MPTICRSARSQGRSITCGVEGNLCGSILRVGNGGGLARPRHAHLLWEFAISGRVKMSIPSRPMPVSVIVVLAFLFGALVPTAVLAATGTFTDDDNSIFEVDIEWMAANGITRGCNPPTNDRFCPDAPVTRGEMAAFMRRFAESQSTDGYSVFRDAERQIEGNGVFETVVELPGLPAGSYVLIANTQIVSFEGGESTVFCRLLAGGDFDATSANLQPSVLTPRTFTVVHSFASDGGVAQLQCDDQGQNMTLRNTKITAIEVNNLTNVPG
ncbi:MAG: S-layer homology domain-containing protein [bacterium]|nr:S-layer homology domain-containing protein [bacterium]